MEQGLSAGGGVTFGKSRLLRRSPELQTRGDGASLNVINACTFSNRIAIIIVFVLPWPYFTPYSRLNFQDARDLMSHECLALTSNF